MVLDGRQPLLERCVDPRRKRPSHGGVIWRAGAQHLDDEQGIPLRVLEQPPRGRRLDGTAQDLLGQRARRGFVERRQLDGVEPAEARRLRLQTLEGVCVAQVAVAHDDQAEAADARVGSEHVAQPFERLVIARMGIVDHQDAWWRLEQRASEPRTGAGVAKAR